MVGDHEYWFVGGNLCCMERIIVSEEDVEKSPAEQLEKAVEARDHSSHVLYLVVVTVESGMNKSAIEEGGGSGKADQSIAILKGGGRKSQR